MNGQEKRTGGKQDNKSIRSAERSLKKALREECFHEALEIIERLKQSSEGNEKKGHYAFFKGCVFEMVGDYQAAVQAYGTGLSFEPRDGRTWYFLHNNLGYSLIKLCKFQEAEYYCKEAIRINKGVYNGFKNLGLALEGQGRILEAAMVLAASPLGLPGSKNSWLLLSELQERNPDLKESAPILRFFAEVMK